MLIAAGVRRHGSRRLGSSSRRFPTAYSQTKWPGARSCAKDRSSTALGTLGYLMQVGQFSHSNVEPLAKLLRDINRHDLVEDMVEPYRREHHDGER